MDKDMKIVVTVFTTILTISIGVFVAWKWMDAGGWDCWSWSSNTLFDFYPSLLDIHWDICRIEFGAIPDF